MNGYPNGPCADAAARLVATLPPGFRAAFEPAERDADGVRVLAGSPQDPALAELARACGVEPLTDPPGFCVLGAALCQSRATAIADWSSGAVARTRTRCCRGSTVASLLKRWLLGTHQGAVERTHLPYYLDEFTFRFNRRTSRRRGMLFYRLVQQALAVDPAPYRILVGGSKPGATQEVGAT